MAAVNTNLIGLDAKELEALVEIQGRPRYHGRQLFRAIYSRRERDFIRLTELNREFREFLSSNYQLTYPSIIQKFVSSDGAARYLLGVEDGKSVETVYMPEEDRVTLCLSSQVGCAVDCRFCFTALLGLQRNLAAGEIVGQVLAVAEAEQIPRGARLNLVMMGMGEPLLNLVQDRRVISDR